MTDLPETDPAFSEDKPRKKDKEVLRQTDEEARRLGRSLLRLSSFGALATLEEGTGHPLASRVALASDLDGTPIILISQLSGHRKALDADSRCSLLLGEPGKGDPLAHPRISLMCRAVRVARGNAQRERLKQRYLARQPKAELYADFGDFDFFRLEVERASLNGGFGKAYALTREDLILREADCAELAEREAGAVAHMNEDHSDAVKLYAEVLLGLEKGEWRLTGLDPEGADLKDGSRLARIWYADHLEEKLEMRPALVALAKKAREGQEPSSS